MAIDEILEEAAEAGPYVRLGLFVAGGPSQDDATPWQFENLVQRRSVTSPDLLDLDTGGGECSRRNRPDEPKTCRGAGPTVGQRTVFGMVERLDAAATIW